MIVNIDDCLILTLINKKNISEIKALTQSNATTRRFQ